MEPAITTRDEFLQRYWTYYLLLEQDFLATEQYIAIDELNFNAYSNEYIKQYQTICSEIDVIAKSFCREMDNTFHGSKIDAYCKCVLDHYADFPARTVKLKDRGIQILPWEEWAYSIEIRGEKTILKVINPDWWKKYNKVKHTRTTINSETQLPYYKLANQRNVLYSLAALFLLEMYYYRKLQQSHFTTAPDMPGPPSKLFDIENWGNTSVMFGDNLWFELD